MLMRNPGEGEFVEIFHRYADKNELDYTEETIQRFIQKHYRDTRRERRRCHPRDVINHAMDLIRFERRPWELTEEVLHLAFESVFVHDDHDAED
jgi:hypothetical protein